MLCTLSFVLKKLFSTFVACKFSTTFTRHFSLYTLVYFTNKDPRVTTCTREFLMFIRKSSCTYFSVIHMQLTQVMGNSSVGASKCSEDCYDNLLSSFICFGHQMSHKHMAHFRYYAHNYLIHCFFQVSP